MAARRISGVPARRRATQCFNRRADVGSTQGAAPPPADIYPTLLIVGMLIVVVTVWVLWAYWQTRRSQTSPAANDDVFAVDPKVQEEAGEWGMLWPM
jgi:hypothetical protein